MSAGELAFASIEPIAQQLRKKKLSPLELIQTMLARIERFNPQLNAYLTVTAEQALGDARRAEREILRGHWRGPLHGVPISLKDNIYTLGVRTTAGSKILCDFVPQRDATVVRRLRRAGAIVLGKTNLHEFAYGVTTNNPHFGPTRNPWDPTRIPGGSSGGSAAAVAAGLCFASVGSDTGGSIRIPAAMCGIVGFKPTFGLVSCHGVVPLAASFDHVGPLARTVPDAAILLRVLAGRDLGASRASRRRLRLGWPGGFFWEKLNEEVRQLAEAAVHSFEREGCALEEIALPHLSESVGPSTRIALAEARHFHESTGYYPERADDYSEEVRKRLELGGQIRAIEYLQGLEVREQVRREFDEALANVDAILAPTVPVAAPRIAEERVRIGTEEEAVRGALLRLNRPANFTGHPAISVPCGFTREGLPVGLQIIGRAFDEALLLRLAGVYEQSHKWSTARPAVA
ncbi:MAG TPA: amidase [Candidatus Acidoferrales bacterium]|nr:amidase [Candidatus Acidoferrales bacterium]